MAHLPRAFLDCPLPIGDSVTLPDVTRKHLVSVLRLRDGAAVQIFNGDGNNYAATLSATKKTATVLIDTQTTGPAPGKAITLALGVSRGDRMDFALQKATELGVVQIQPLWTERCGAKIPTDRLPKKLQHWQNVVISASEQCGRCTVPGVNAPAEFDAWLPSQAPGFVLTPTATASLRAQSIATEQHWTVLVGPESGLSDREVSAATAANWLPTSLGPLVLRTETAATVAVAMLRSADSAL